MAAAHMDNENDRIGIAAGVLQVLGLVLALGMWRSGAEHYQTAVPDLALAGAAGATLFTGASWLLSPTRLIAMVLAVLAAIGAVGTDGPHGIRFAIAMLAVAIGCALPAEPRGTHA